MSRCARCEQEGTCPKHHVSAIPVPPPPPRERELTPEELTWSVRGEPRTRATFAAPHPGDFSGGLPVPPECPVS